MSRRTITTITALLAAGALTLTACARSDDPGPSEADEQQAAEHYTPGFYEEEPSGDPTPGGTLTYADYQEARTLNPTEALPGTYGNGTPMSAIYDTLVRWNERTQEFEPRLAESIEPNEDFTQWTITVRPDVEFSDGTPVNADAVIGSMNHYVQNQGRDLGVIGPLWGGVEKVDDMTLQVNLTDSWASFEFALGLNIGFIMAPAAIADPENFQPIGAGPFMFESYKPAEELILTKNPNYWDGEPYLDSLRFVWLGADQTKLEAMNSDSIHATVIRDVNVLRTAREADTSGFVWVENFGNMIMMNRADGRPAGEYPQIAPAISHALDADAIDQRVNDGMGLPTKHLFGPQSEWYNEDAEPPAYDPEEATKFLEEAKAAGFDGRLNIASNGDPKSREVALTLQAQLEAVGFEVELDFARTVADQTAKIFAERNFDFAPMGLSLSDTDPYWRLFASLHSKSVANVSSYANPEYDALIEELRETQGEDRRDVLNRIEQHFFEEYPTIPFAMNANMAMWQDNVHGMLPGNDQQISFEKVWISE